MLLLVVVVVTIPPAEDCGGRVEAILLLLLLFGLSCLWLWSTLAPAFGCGQPCLQALVVVKNSFGKSLLLVFDPHRTKFCPLTGQLPLPALDHQVSLLSFSHPSIAPFPLSTSFWLCP